MIPYIEILRQGDRKKIGLVEPLEFWGELSYFEVGEFEVYCLATQDNLDNLKLGNFVKIPNKRYLWIITAIKYSFTKDGLRVIIAHGKEAKYLLNKRIVLNPLELPTDLGSAVYELVYKNMGAGASLYRSISDLEVEKGDFSISIPTTQATRSNLLEFVINLLKTYDCGAQIVYENGKLVFKQIYGQDKTQTVKFSQSLDNLLSSEYYTDDESDANYVLVVNKIDEVDYVYDVDEFKSGINRNEIFIDSSLSTKYEDANGNETEIAPTSELFRRLQLQEGRQTLATKNIVEEVSGEIAMQFSLYEFDKDYYLGDIVEVNDEFFKYSFKTRVLKIRFKQDAKAYGEELEYGNF